MVKVERATRFQQVYDQLLAMLLDGTLPPDSQLDERELSARLGVSRTPLREAIAQLAREGLVESVAYKGHFVRHWTAQQVNDLYLVRGTLEALAVRLAIPKLSNEDIDAIDGLLREAEDALERGDIEGFGDADRRFHRALIVKADNQPLIEALDRLSLQIQMVRTMANRDPGVQTRTTHERSLILAALRDRDADRAAQLMEAHIGDVRAAVVAQLRAQEAAG
jgi:DNA-binding GntR family transcriptional regulator